MLCILKYTQTSGIHNILWQEASQVNCTHQGLSHYLFLSLLHAGSIQYLFILAMEETKKDCSPSNLPCYSGFEVKYHSSLFR